ncbi:MAG: type IV secretion system protein [Rickettsiales bacterium]
MLLFSNPAFGWNPYSNCILSTDWSGNTRTAVTVTPIGSSCQQLCAQQCGIQITATQFQPNVGLSRTTVANGTELNADVILQCLSDCQTGSNNMSYYVRQDQAPAGSTTSDILFVGPIINTVSCDPNTGQTQDSANYNAIWTGITTQTGDQVSIYPIGNGLDSTVYMCGQKFLEMVPLISSINTNDWTNQTAPQTLWQPGQHSCLLANNPLSQTQVQGLSNQQLWNYAGLSYAQLQNLTGPLITDFTTNTLFPMDSLCMWNSRNPQFTNTGIYIQDGDELSISWSGDFAWEGSNAAFPWSLLGTTPIVNPPGTDRAFAFNFLMNPSNAAADIATATNWWRQNSGLQLLAPGDSNDPYGTNALPKTIYGEDARVAPYTIKNLGLQVTPPTPSATPAYSIYGLAGSFQDLNIVYTTNTTSSSCNTPTKQAMNFNTCNSVSNPGLGSYTFTGALSGFSSTKTPLAIRHWDVSTSDIATDIKYWSDNLGGYTVAIYYGGCPQTLNTTNANSGLQYAVLPNYDNSSDSPANRFTAIQAATLTWAAVPVAVLNQSTTLNIPAPGGMLLFRIASNYTVPSGSSDPNLAALYAPGNQYGQYVVAVNDNTQSAFLVENGPFRELVRYVEQVLFGNPTASNIQAQQGIVQVLYVSFIEESYVKNIIRAFLALYFAFLGLGFMTGAIHMTQHEAVMRALTVGAVVALISDQSWTLINTYFFPFFTTGVTTLIADFVSGSVSMNNATGFTEAQLQQDPTLIFSVFDAAVAQLASAPFWIKIATLFFSGVFGAWLAIVILIATGFFAWAITKAVLMYLMSMIIIAMLMVVSPIFIPFALYKQTKYLFDSWWKNLISFAIQPVAVFLGVVIFSLLFSLILIEALAFSACEVCLVDIAIPGVINQCILQGFTFLQNMNMPVGVDVSYSAPFTAVSMIFLSVILLMVAHAASEFVDYIPGMITGIVTGDLTARTMSIANYGSAARSTAIGGVANTVRVGAVKPVGAVMYAPRLAYQTAYKPFKKGITGKTRV